MKHNYRLLSFFVLIGFFLGACNLGTDTSNEQATAAAETANAMVTRALETAAAENIPSATPEPEATATSIPANTATATALPITATNTAIPCNRAEFVNDVNYPDNTEVATGTAFTKTWRIKNTGSCTWTADYVLLFDSGDQMNAPTSASFTSNSIAPGETVDISVALVAPTTPGTYQGQFKLRSPDNVAFGINDHAQAAFWVKIVVPAAPQLTKPDLLATSFTITPNPAVQNAPVEVSVTIKNQGQTNAGQFKVYWLAGETFTISCQWVIPALAAGASITQTCNTYQYGATHTNITTTVMVDTDGNAVDESDESNNEATLNIEVKSP